MEEQEGTKFVDWMDSLTVTDAVNTLLLITFTVFILVLVVRTFRNKSSA